MKNKWQFILILIFGLVVAAPVVHSGYFPHHDDLQVMRIFEMRRCFADLQLPCRWVPDMGYGNGFPLYNYYGVLPYYIGGILSYFLGYIGAAKALFFIPLVIAGLSMYFLAKELYGKTPALVAASLYTFAPYRAVDTYVRGAIAESFAISLAPLIFLFSYRLTYKNTRLNFVMTSLSVTLFVLNHNLMTLIFVSVLILWNLFHLYLTKFKNLIPLLLSSLLGVGIASFFLIPASLEQNLVQIDTLTQGGSNFRAHFVTVNQLFFSRYWGYGVSQFGPNDTMSFQIGYPHVMLIILALLVLIFAIFKKKDTENTGRIILLFLVFFVSVILMLPKSIVIWEAILPLKFIQFPWRFLTLVIFSSSLIGAYVVIYLTDRLKLGVSLVIVLLTVGLNLNYFKPNYYYELTDKEKLSGESFKIQQQAGILDYLPKTAQEPKGPRPEKPEVISGKAEVGKFTDNSNNWNFTIKVFEKANIEVPVFDFPVWKTFLNGKLIDHSNQNRLGRIRLDLNPGSYTVNGRFENTLVRNIANSLSIISFLVFLSLLLPFKGINKLWK